MKTHGIFFLSADGRHCCDPRGVSHIFDIKRDEPGIQPVVSFPYVFLVSFGGLITIIITKVNDG